MPQIPSHLPNGLLCSLFYGIPQLGGKANRPHHTQRVFLKTLLGLTHTPDKLPFHILQPAKGIHQPRPVVICHSINGKIPALQVFPQVRSKGNLLRMPAVLIFPVNTVSGHLEAFPPQHHRHRPMLYPRIYGMPEKGLHLLRAGRSGNIPVIRNSP